MICTSCKLKPNLFKFVFYNPCLSYPPFSILAHFILTSLLFVYASKLAFKGFLLFNGNHAVFNIPTGKDTFIKKTRTGFQNIRKQTLNSHEDFLALTLTPEGGGGGTPI